MSDNNPSISLMNKTCDPFCSLTFHEVAKVRNNSTNDTSGLNIYEDVIKRIQGSVIVILNIFVMMILIRRNLRGTNSTKLFLNLQVTHIMIAISVVTFGSHTTTIFVLLNNVMLMGMFLILMTTTIDRLIAIKYPFIYASLTSKHCLIVIVSSWFLPVIFLCIGLNCDYGKYTYLVLSTILIAIATVILTSSSIIVYGVVKRHVNMIKLNRVIDNESGKREQSIKLAKSIFVCLLIVMTFVLCWFPYLVHDILTLANIYEPSSDKAFTMIVEVIALCNSGLDPIFYVLLNKNVKREIIKLKRRKFGFEHILSFNASGEN